MYRARHYVRINGRMYTRGENIPDDLAAEKIAWLTKAGAIEEITPTPADETENKNPAEETGGGQEDQAAGETPEEAEAEEADEEAEVPEIDVMAGIVQTEADEEPQKSERKTAAKKQAGRRKSG